MNVFEQLQTYWKARVVHRAYLGRRTVNGQIRHIWITVSRAADGLWEEQGNEGHTMEFPAVHRQVGGVYSMRVAQDSAGAEVVVEVYGNPGVRLVSGHSDRMKVAECQMLDLLVDYTSMGDSNAWNTLLLPIVAVLQKSPDRHVKAKIIGAVVEYLTLWS